MSSCDRSNVTFGIGWYQVAIGYNPPRMRKESWKVTLWIRGREHYIGSASSYEAAVEIERKARKNFPPETRRNPLNPKRVGWFREPQRDTEADK